MPGTDSDDGPTAAAGIAARIDRLPATRTLWLLVLLISLGGFFEIYDVILTGYIAPGLAKSGVLATTTRSMFGLDGIGGFIAATFAGLFVGTCFLGFLADRYGRRTIFTFALLWYSIGSAIIALQTTAEGMLLWRLITGIGVGIEIVTIDVYLMELVPQHMRGRAMALNQAVMFVAAPAVALLSYELIPLAPLGFDGWRWVVLIGSSGAVVVWFIRRQLPESPRWLAQRGRISEAERILRSIETRVQARHGGPLPTPPPPIVIAATPRFRAIWSPPYRSRTVMMLVFNLFQGIGYYGFANWVPTLLIEDGILVTKSLWYSFVIAIALPLGPILAMTVADKLERKWTIVGAAVAISVCGMTFSQMREPAIVVVLGILISLGSQLLSVSHHAYQAELFPTAIRSRASGVVYSFSRLGAGISGWVIAFCLRDFGVTGVFVTITACYVIAIAAIAGFGPSTTGRRLDAIAQ